MLQCCQPTVNDSHRFDNCNFSPKAVYIKHSMYPITNIDS